MNEKWKKIGSIASTVIVSIVVVCAVILMGSRLLGFKCYTVISGSMEPEYSVGDLLYVKKAEFSEIKVGDPITFVLNENLVVATHRVVRIDTENQRFYTKGDANDIEDSEPVYYKNVIGVPKLAVPFLGYVSDYVQNPPGMYITIAIGAVLILLVFLPDLLVKKKDDDNEKIQETKAELTSAEEENERLKAEIERLKAETIASPCSAVQSSDSAEESSNETK